MFTTVTIPKGTKIYHERGSFFSDGSDKPSYSYNWFSFKPGFFTQGDPPSYTAVWYMYELQTDIDNLVETSYTWGMDDLNKKLKEIASSYNMIYSAMSEFDDYTPSAWLCEGFKYNGISCMDDNKIILSREVINKIKLFDRKTFNNPIKCEVEKIVRGFNGKDIHLSDEYISLLAKYKTPV